MKRQVFIAGVRSGKALQTIAQIRNLLFSQGKDFTIVYKKDPNGLYRGKATLLLRFFWYFECKIADKHGPEVATNTVWARIARAIPIWLAIKWKYLEIKEGIR